MKMELVKIAVVDDRGEYLDVVKHYKIDKEQREVNATVTKATYLADMFMLKLSSELKDEFQQIVNATWSEGYSEGQCDGEDY